jgi:hypothetical protein
MHGNLGEALVGWKRILGYNSADILALLMCLRHQLGGDEKLKKVLHRSVELQDCQIY